MGYNKMTEKTPKGYNPYDLMSALQKFIRRSMEREALFCFYELEAHGLYHLAKSRLNIIVYEDVGIANPGLLNSINSHIEKMDKWYKLKNGAWRLVLGNIILSACRGNKTRIADYFVCSVAAEIANGYKVNFNKHNFVFDMHTRKGKQMGRGSDHFYNEAAKIIESNITTDYREAEIESFRIAKEKGLDVFEDYRKSDKKEPLQGEINF